MAEFKRVVFTRGTFVGTLGEDRPALLVFVEGRSGVVYPFDDTVATATKVHNAIKDSGLSFLSGCEAAKDWTFTTDTRAVLEVPDGQLPPARGTH